MDLTQKNINFGTVPKHASHPQRTIVVNNLSDVPLVYRVKKSGSIASLDLVIPKTDRMGIIRPYRRREVHFSFRPKITGPFNEKLTIENIYDASNSQVITVKAFVRPTTSFFIRSLRLDFGACIVGHKSKRCQIILSNTSNQRRQFDIKVDPAAGYVPSINSHYFIENFTIIIFIILLVAAKLFQSKKTSFRHALIFLFLFLFFHVLSTCDYDMYLRLERTAPIVLTKEEEEQVTHLMQRLKIAKRKGQEEKVSKYMEKLNKIHAGKIKKESPGSSNVASGYNSDIDGGQSSSDLGVVAPSSQAIDRTEGKLSASNRGNKYSVHRNAISVFIDGGGVCSVVAVLKLKSLKKPSEGSTPDETSSATTSAVTTASTILPTANSDGGGGTTPVEGKLLVYEVRNVDVVKHVQWKATMCHNHETYMHTVLSEAQRQGSTPDLSESDDAGGFELDEELGSPEELITPPNSPSPLGRASLVSSIGEQTIDSPTVRSPEVRYLCFQIFIWYPKLNLLSCTFKQLF